MIVFLTAEDQTSEGFDPTDTGPKFNVRLSKQSDNLIFSFDSGPGTKVVKIVVLFPIAPVYPGIEKQCNTSQRPSQKDPQSLN